MEYGFYALVSRMKNINRWALMRNSSTENVQEHSHMTAVLAHALAAISRDILGTDVDPNAAAAAALLHDASEIITGDMPTPVKYYSDDIKNAYKNVERVAGETKWSFAKLFRYALDGIIEYTEAPMHFCSWTGAILSVVMLAELIVLLVMSLCGRQISAAVLIISCILFMGGILMLGLGIISEYLLKTYSEVRKRPHYIVKNYYE